MKKIITALLVAIFLTFGGVVLTACVQNGTNDKLVIYTSFYPLYDFAKNVGGDKVEVINLTKAGEEAHHYEPSTRQMAGMETADLIVINGLEMESWTSSLPNKLKQKIVDTSSGATLIARTTNENPTNYAYEQNSQNAADPHIWLSIKNAVKQMENIKNALARIDAQNATYYQTRFEIYSHLFNGLDSQFALALADIQSRNLVVSHRAFGYLAFEYNLVQYSLGGIESNAEPSPATLAEITDFVNNNNVTAIFYQENANTQVAQTISNNTNAKLYMLSTVESLTEQEIANGETYLTVMAKNLTNLVNALS